MNCKHDKLNKECWRVIFLPGLRNDVDVAVAQLIGKTIMCAECLQRIKITKDWLYERPLTLDGGGA